MKQGGNSVSSLLGFKMQAVSFQKHGLNELLTDVTKVALNYAFQLLLLQQEEPNPHTLSK